MTDQWETVVEDEALADPLIVPAQGPLEDDEPGVDETRAAQARGREDTLLARDADRDLTAQRARKPRTGRSKKLSSSSGRRTTGG